MRANLGGTTRIKKKHNDGAGDICAMWRSCFSGYDDLETLVGSQV